MKKLSWLGVLSLAAGCFGAQADGPPALDSIREEDLKSDLTALADAHFNGRSAGTLDELKAATWVAEKYRAIGLKPAGDDGTYFQFFTLWRNQLSERSSIALNGTPLAWWKEAALTQPVHVSLNAPVVYLGAAGSFDLATVDVAGRVVAFEANPAEYNPNKSLPTWRYSGSLVTKYGVPLIARGAAAILIVADEVGEKAWDDATENFKRGLYDIEGGTNVDATAKAPIIWLRSSAKAILARGDAQLTANLLVAKYPYPSVNVIGIAPGSDAARASEYVLYSGHTDAHGIRNPIGGDAIYHGADDNASVDVALFASARAFIKRPAARPVLFVIHGAEERGLFGSKYYAAHPTVPVGSIVAVLNGDMIGRNDTNSAALLGVTPPHRNSAELVAMAMAANEEGPKFTVDSSWDAVTHIEGWYFRSDHLPYARLGIPALMYSSLLHPDYHTPQDNAENINYPKLKKMTEWMYRTGWKVANAPKRPAVDENFKLER